MGFVADGNVETDGERLRLEALFSAQFPIVGHRQPKLVTAGFQFAGQGREHIGQCTSAGQRPAFAADHQDLHAVNLAAEFAAGADFV
jgi:hypothetical protein